MLTRFPSFRALGISSEIVIGSGESSELSGQGYELRCYRRSGGP